MGVDRVRSLRKIPTRLRGTNFCTSLTRFALSIGRQPNSPKCTQIVQKARKQEFRVQWVGWGAFIAKNSNTTLWHELLHQFDPFCIECCKATKGSQMHLNSTKRTKMWVLGPMGQIGCFSCEKFRCDFVAWTFAPVLSRFAPSFVRQPNSRKCTQIVENRPKHEFRVQWGGSGAFVVKNSDGTSWHEVFHQFDPFYTKCCYATKQSQIQPNNTKHTKAWV